MPDTIGAPVSQLSRVALLYLLATLGAGVGLLALEMPAWITLTGAGCLLWRLLIHAGLWPFPNAWLKALLVVGSCTGIAVQYRSGLSLEVYVALLISGLALKALEVYHTRAAHGFLWIAILALMAFLLFAGGFIGTLLAVLQVALIVAALAAINADPSRLAARPLVPLRTAAITLGCAAPLLVFLFVVMPRLPPLWTMPLQRQEARIGMGEDMSPGEFSRASRSAELAFRAGFSGPIPPSADLYWRGTVLDEFDGRRWKNHCDCNDRWQATGTRPAGRPAYNIVLEPHGQRWVFTLDQARLADDRITSNGENLFRFRRERLERATYDVWPPAEPPPPPALTPEARARHTRLPESGNPRAMALAQEWRRATADDTALIEKALALFHRSFTYTLEPPLLGRDSVDEFLFGTQRGFCEHFASAFAWLMRAAGLPARVVMGYQGGQRNLQEHYVTVRQYDAHAWAEVWRENTGWVRVDPTAAVAPERVEHGFAELFPDSPAFSTLLGYQAHGRQSLLGLLRVKLDHLDYLVGRWVLGYDPDRQQSLLRRLGLASPRGLLIAFAGGLSLVLATFLLYLYFRDRHRHLEHPLTARYRRLCDRYTRLGWQRLPSETPLHFAIRVKSEHGPEAEALLQLSRQYAEWSYRPLPPKPDERGLQRSLSRLRWRLFWRQWRRIENISGSDA